MIDVSNLYQNRYGKKTDQNFKIKIVEALWRIIYSDGNADIYENSLMRRLTGLMYLNPKTVGCLLYTSDAADE